MTKGIGHGRDELYDDEADGWIDNLFADEKSFDGQMMFRLGVWGVSSIAAVVAAFFATQAPDSWRRDPSANVALADQAQQLQLALKNSQNEARRLAAAVDTLNSDRDRLYSRVTVLEQSLDSVTGSIAKSATSSATLPQVNASPEGSTAADKSVDANATSLKKTDLPAFPSIAAVKSAPPGSASGAATDSTPGPIASVNEMPNSSENKIQPTQFGIDIGGANSLEVLRAVWRGALKSNQPLLGSLQPIVMMKEGRDGLGMRLRLVAGPFDDAAATARACATLINSKRPCSTSAYDGQRLAVDFKNGDEPQSPAPRRPKPNPAATPPASSPVSPYYRTR
jgi:hypothetical protein